MINFETDQSRNLFVIRYSGHIGPEEIESGLDELQDALAPFQAGFQLLGDLSQLESMDPACAPFIEKAMDLFNLKGVARVIRVIPDPHRDIGLGIMSIFHYRGNVQIVTCETLDQAMQLLGD